jgi:hypothetical protein
MLHDIRIFKATLNGFEDNKVKWQLIDRVFDFRFYCLLTQETYFFFVIKILGQ